jgi:hypothetical protein
MQGGEKGGGGLPEGGNKPRGPPAEQLYTVISAVYDGTFGIIILM